MKLPQGADPHHPKYTQGTVKNLDSVMVWSAFVYHGKGKLVVLPELLCDHLEDCFGTCKSEVFMQDGAPAQTTKLVKK